MIHIQDYGDVISGQFFLTKEKVISTDRVIYGLGGEEELVEFFSSKYNRYAHYIVHYIKEFNPGFFDRLNGMEKHGAGFFMQVPLGKGVEDICKSIQSLNSYYTKGSIEKALDNYPKLLTNLFSPYHDSIDGIKIDILLSCAPSLRLCFYGGQGEKKERKAFELLSKYAIELMNEIRNFKIDTSELVRCPQSTNQSDLPVWLKVAGIITLKAICFSLLSNINLPFDLNSDNNDLPFDPSNNIDTNDIALGFQSSGGVNISFGSQNVSLTAQGGKQHLEVSITKEPGSSNLFCISSDKGIVHNVSGGDNWVKIANIIYKLPKLKG